METMTPALEAHLRSLSDSQRKRLASNTRKALRNAWPHRHTSWRAPQQIHANVTMLRNLASL